MKTTSRFQVTRDDQNLLSCLWRWKLLTTSLIHQAIYKSRSVEMCYRRLLKLEKQKFIESYPSLTREMSVWQLTDKGYQILDFGDKDLDHSGFRSENPEHDFWVTAIQLGAWMDSKPLGVDLFTEQEIRKYETSSFPKWVPHTKQHRPDGWFKVDLNQPNDKSLIALEVEFSKKAPVSYSDVGKFYSSAILVHQVLWFVRSKRDAEYIFEHLKSGSDTKASEHSFILIDHFIQSQYQAQVHLGKDLGKSLIEILKITNTDTVSSPLQHRLLDIRKYPINPSTLKLADKVELGLKRYMRSEKGV